MEIEVETNFEEEGEKTVRYTVDEKNILEIEELAAKVAADIGWEEKILKRMFSNPAKGWFVVHGGARVTRSR